MEHTVDFSSGSLLVMLVIIFLSGVSTALVYTFVGGTYLKSRR